MLKVEIRDIHSRMEYVSSHRTKSTSVAIERAVKKHFGSRAYYRQSHGYIESNGYGTILKENSDCNVICECSLVCE